MTDVLRIEDVSVRFGGVVAVDAVSLGIGRGELVGFIGPNGAGKTTLMRAITGMVKPTRGRVLLEGRDLTGWPVHRRMRAGLALAQQIVRPIGAMSLLDNVALALGRAKTRHAYRAMAAMDRRTERAQARALLERVGLGALAEARPATQPLGHLKRLEMARALALAPKLLLLDEPLAGLGQAEAHTLADLIADLNRAGQTILLIEHNLREVLRICPTLYVQDNGRALAFGASAAVMANAEVRRVYLGGHA